MFEKVILKSAHPSEYPDLEVVCRVIPNDQIGAYLDTIPAEKKFYGYKKAAVLARPGVVGEKIKTTLKTFVDGKEYILSEEENIVKERPIKTATGKEIIMSDIVVTNHNSTSNEEYIVKFEKFINTYTTLGNNEFEPVYDSRLLTQVDENVIIMTSWGAPAVCLAGSYIVTYNADANDYNTIEKGAFNSTYVIEEPDVTRKLSNN